MTVYCVMNDEGALITIYRNRGEAELALVANRSFGWYIVERYVY